MDELFCEPYSEAQDHWPQVGQHVLAQYTDESIVVYQAFSPAIGHYAAAHGRFLGCPAYLPGRMSWIKTNFLWMMFRSGWGCKPNQEVTLAIVLRRSFFEEVLASAVGSRSYVQGDDAAAEHKEARKSEGFDRIRLQWDPDHLPNGASHPGRRAVQLGLKGEWLRRVACGGDDVLRIVDVSAFVEEQRANFEAGRPLTVPVERLYGVDDPETRRKIGLSVPLPPPLRLLCVGSPAADLEEERRRVRGVAAFTFADDALAAWGSGGFDGLVACEGAIPAAVAALAQEQLQPPPRFVVLAPSRHEPLALDTVGPVDLPSLHTLAHPELQACFVTPELSPAYVGQWPLKAFLRPFLPAELLDISPPPAPSAPLSEVEEKRVAKKKEKRAAKQKGAEAEELPKLRLLCVHGYMQSGPVFAKRLKQLRGKLRNVAELVFPTAPFALPPSSEEEEAEEAEALFTWWYYSEEDRTAFAEAITRDETEYIGVEQSLALLRGVWAEQGPFDGVLGFSQGAEMAAILVADLLRDEALASPRFCMLASGFLRPRPSNLSSWYPPPAGPMPLPSFHMFGEQDALVPKWRSEELVTVFAPEERQVLEHDGAHYVPQRKEYIPLLVGWLQGFRSGGLGAAGASA